MKRTKFCMKYIYELAGLYLGYMAGVIYSWGNIVNLVISSESYVQNLEHKAIGLLTTNVPII